MITPRTVFPLVIGKQLIHSVNDQFAEIQLAFKHIQLIEMPDLLPLHILVGLKPFLNIVAVPLGHQRSTRPTQSLTNQKKIKPIKMRALVSGVSMMNNPMASVLISLFDSVVPRNGGHLAPTFGSSTLVHGRPFWTCLTNDLVESTKQRLVMTTIMNGPTGLTVTILLAMAIMKIDRLSPIVMFATIQLQLTLELDLVAVLL